MFKKILTSLIIGAVFQVTANDEVVITIQSEKTVPTEQVTKPTVLFEVKKSTVFEDFNKRLDSSDQEHLKSFIKHLERRLLDSNEFLGLVNRYQLIFNQLNIGEKPSKITLIFAFEKENWLELTQSLNVEVNILKNSFSESQLNELNANLQFITDSFTQVMSELLNTPQMAELQKMLKEKSYNQKIRLGFALS